MLWFRRDLRLADHPALLAALDAADEVVPLFVVDPFLQRTSGRPRLAFLAGCLADLHERTGGALLIRTGTPAEVVAAVAGEVDASTVFATADFGPYGRRRDEAVAAALGAGGRSLVALDSPYAAPPGTVVKADGAPYGVYTPFYRAWSARRLPGPVAEPRRPRWAGGLTGEPVPRAPDLAGTRILPPGEAAAHQALDRFLDGPVRAYAEGRDRLADDGTSRLSVYLKYGCLHPRQVLDRLGSGAGAVRFRQEVAWRDFYADVLFRRPESARCPLQRPMVAMRYDEGAEADRRFQAWTEGRTGYPIVDAGMRQLRAEAYVHNRVRMIVASFLVKDLHIDPFRGARWFMQHLQDGDLASNQHGWQWVAGTGTDPAPYFRIFNPVRQGREHDPEGRYIRRYVEELAGVAAPAVHEPWTRPGGPPAGYPAPIVDHAVERREALARYAAARDAGA